MSGVWLDSAPEEHHCRLPILWPFHVRIGDRWKCQCGRVWRVTAPLAGDHARRWMPEDKAVDAELRVFRPVTDEQLWYWVNHELDLQTPDQDVSAETLIEVIRKHFEIGSRT